MYGRDIVSCLGMEFCEHPRELTLLELSAEKKRDEWAHPLLPGVIAGYINIISL